MARNWAIWWTLASITWSLHRRCCVYVWVCAYVRAAGCMCTRPRVFVGNGGSVWVYVCVWGRPWVRLLEWILNWSLKVTSLFTSLSSYDSLAITVFIFVFSRASFHFFDCSRGAPIWLTSMLACTNFHLPFFIDWRKNLSQCSSFFVCFFSPLIAYFSHFFFVSFLPLFFYLSWLHTCNNLHYMRCASVSPALIKASLSIRIFLLYAFVSRDRKSIQSHGSKRRNI